MSLNLNSMQFFNINWTKKINFEGQIFQNGNSPQTLRSQTQCSTSFYYGKVTIGGFSIYETDNCHVISVTSEYQTKETVDTFYVTKRSVDISNIDTMFALRHINNKDRIFTQNINNVIDNIGKCINVEVDETSRLIDGVDMHETVSGTYIDRISPTDDSLRLIFSRKMEYIYKSTMIISETKVGNINQVIEAVYMFTFDDEKAYGKLYTYKQTCASKGKQLVHDIMKPYILKKDNMPHRLNLPTCGSKCKISSVEHLSYDNDNKTVNITGITKCNEFVSKEYKESVNNHLRSDDFLGNIAKESGYTILDQRDIQQNKENK